MYIEFQRGDGKWYKNKTHEYTEEWEDYLNYSGLPARHGFNALIAH